MIELPSAKDTLLQRHAGVSRVYLRGDPRIAEAYLGRAKVYMGWLRNALALGGVGAGVRHINLENGVKIRVLFDGAMNVIDVYAPPVKESDESLIMTGYLETGLLVFDGFTCVEGDEETAAFLLSNDDLSNWESTRQAADQFTWIGEMRYSRPSKYPPLAPLPGSRDHTTDRSEVWLCPRALAQVVNDEATDGLVASTHPASLFSGRLMVLFVQAKYGAGATVRPTQTDPLLGLYVGPADEVMIDGVALFNNKTISHWLLEYRDNERIEWWCMEARINGVLSAQRLELDSLGRQLAQDIIRFGITDDDDNDLDWIRAWIFRGATFKTESAPIATDIPAGKPLVYGWHVSDTGTKASIHTRVDVTTLQAGETVENWGQDWSRYDMTLTLTYAADGAPLWDVQINTVETGYLEIPLTEAFHLHVWSINADTWTAEPIITDARLSRPPVILSDAEVYGWYVGEEWRPIKIDEVDEDQTFTSSYQMPYADGCEIFAQNPRIYYGGTPSRSSPFTATRRTTQTTIGDFMLDRSAAGSDTFIWTEDFSHFQYGDWSATGTLLWCGGVGPPDPPEQGDYNYIVLWRRILSGRMNESVEQVSNRSRGGQIAFSPVIGACDTGVVINRDTESAAISLVKRYTVLPYQLEAEYHGQTFYPSTYESGDVLTGLWSAQANHLLYKYQGNPPETVTSTDSGDNEKDSIVANFLYRDTSHVVYQDSGGTLEVEASLELGGYEAGAIDFKGWLGYLTVSPLSILFPVAPLYASQSAVTSIWRATQWPAGPQLWSDESFGELSLDASTFVGAL